jgi:hypothetical protein
MLAYNIHNLSIGIQTIQLSPTTVRTTTMYETRRKLDQLSQNQIEEKYEVILSSDYDESGLKILSSKPMIGTESEAYFELDEEVYIACAIVNESLYDNNADKKKVVKYN